MIDCDDLIADLHGQTREQVHLAIATDAISVAAMHIDLALFCGERLRFAEQLCDETAEG